MMSAPLLSLTCYLGLVDSSQVVIQELLVQSQLDYAKDIVKSRMSFLLHGIMKIFSNNQFISQLCKRFDAINEIIISNTSEEAILNISNIPTFAILFDIRVLISIFGLACLIMICIPSKRNNNNRFSMYNRVKALSMPIFLSLAVLKFILSVTCLTFNPTLYFSFSCLLFGANMISILSLLFDLAAFIIIFDYLRRHRFVLYDSPSSLIKFISEKLTGSKSSGDSLKDSIIDSSTVFVACFVGARLITQVLSPTYSFLISVLPISLSKVLTALVEKFLSPFYNVIFKSVWYYSFNRFFNIPNTITSSILSFIGINSWLGKNVFGTVITSVGKGIFGGLVALSLYKLIATTAFMIAKLTGIKIDTFKKYEFIGLNTILGPNLSNRQALSTRFNKSFD